MNDITKQLNQFVGKQAVVSFDYCNQPISRRVTGVIRGILYVKTVSDVFIPDLCDYAVLDEDGESEFYFATNDVAATLTNVSYSKETLFVVLK